MSAPINKILSNMAQSLSESEKATARSNIGAASAVSLSDETARAIAAEVASATYDSDNKLIRFKNAANTQLFTLDATAFVTSGMIESVVVEDGYLKITFITESGTEEIDVDVSTIFDATNYYTKSETNTLLDNKSSVTHTHKVTINGVTKTISAPDGTSVDLGTYLTQHQDVTGKANKSEMGVSTSGDRTTITLKSGMSTTVINTHQDISGKLNAPTTMTSDKWKAVCLDKNLSPYLAPKTCVYGGMHATGKGFIIGGEGNNCWNRPTLKILLGYSGTYGYNLAMNLSNALNAWTNGGSDILVWWSSQEFNRGNPSQNIGKNYWSNVKPPSTSLISLTDYVTLGNSGDSVRWSLDIYIAASAIDGHTARDCLFHYDVMAYNISGSIYTFWKGYAPEVGAAFEANFPYGWPSN